jgi:hypothetical protein
MNASVNAGEAVRMAKCRCGRQEVSSKSLAFFSDQGADSSDAANTCGKCKYYECAHRTQPGNVDPRSVIELGRCDGFVVRGALPHDQFYCGCRGWD